MWIIRLRIFDNYATYQDQAHRTPSHACMVLDFDGYFSLLEFAIVHITISNTPFTSEIMVHVGRLVFCFDLMEVSQISL